MSGITRNIDSPVDEKNAWICCGLCSIAVASRARPEGYQLDHFVHNPRHHQAIRHAPVSSTHRELCYRTLNCGLDCARWTYGYRAWSWL